MLDIGCGDGALLRLLADTKEVDGRGLELSQKGVNDCVAKGLAVIQGDADTDLADLPGRRLRLRHPQPDPAGDAPARGVLEHMLRIGRRAIVSFPNFGHWRVRWFVACAGRMPVTDTLPYSWYDTPNIHHCTVARFSGARRRHRRQGGARRRHRPCRPADAGEHPGLGVEHLVGDQAVFLLRRGGG